MTTEQSEGTLRSAVRCVMGMTTSRIGADTAIDELTDTHSTVPTAFYAGVSFALAKVQRILSVATPAKSGRWPALRDVVFALWVAALVAVPRLLADELVPPHVQWWLTAAVAFVASVVTSIFWMLWRRR